MALARRGCSKTKQRRVAIGARMKRQKVQAVPSEFVLEHSTQWEEEHHETCGSPLNRQIERVAQRKHAECLNLEPAAKSKRRRIGSSCARLKDQKVQDVPLDFLLEPAPSTQWEEEYGLSHCVEGAGSVSHCVELEQHETCGSPLNRQIEPEPAHQECLITVPQSDKILIPVITTIGTQTSPSKSLENEVAELRADFQTFMSKSDKRMAVISAKLDRLLNLSVPRGELTQHSGFTMEPIEEVSQLIEFNSKLDGADYKESVELWLTTMIQEADCRGRLNDAVELCLHKKLLAKMTWTGVGNDKTAMREFENVHLHVSRLQ
ncbi:AGAP005307-PA-like protein [Anopheles sinensis]|uniref:AGAP005307-PA-like protein n=1 Tax=Anopheles sinensis TaxID=74873 RepID=A0A084VL55_ANOSI|nr:AGAP005307-PA-like protein [Anopheles sinensis]